MTSGYSSGVLRLVRRAIPDFDERQRSHVARIISLLRRLERGAGGGGLGHVIDLGCGSGEHLRAIAAVGIGDAWTGIDPALSSVRSGRSRGRKVDYVSDRVGDGTGGVICVTSARPAVTLVLGHTVFHIGVQGIKRWLTLMDQHNAAPAYIIFDVADRWDAAVGNARASGLGVMVEPLVRSGRSQYARLTIARPNGVERGILRTRLGSNWAPRMLANEAFFAPQECVSSADFVSTLGDLGYSESRRQGFSAQSGWADVRVRLLRRTRRI